jgi:hypothetical protein
MVADESVWQTSGERACARVGNFRRAVEMADYPGYEGD